jgi:hypothetical protein
MADTLTCPHTGPMGWRCTCPHSSERLEHGTCPHGWPKNWLCRGEGCGPILRPSEDQHENELQLEIVSD